MIDHVSKLYGPRQVLHNIVAELTVGDVLLITGHNGVGKSTLLRLLAGLQRPSSGTVRYETADVGFEPGEAQHLIGMVGPDIQLYRELTAREHVVFVCDVRGLHNDAESQRKALADVGLEKRADEYVARFSSGMLQRLRYALALLHRPPVLLLDEPTTNLDAAGVAMVDRVVAEQRMRGITVIATNDPRDRTYGDFVLALGEV